MRSGDLVATSSSNTSAPPSIKTARSAPLTAAAIGELNTQAYGSNVSSNAHSSINEPDYKRREALGASQHHSVSEVYSNFISAVSCSLSHSLGKAQGWIQVGPNACIDVRTLSEDLFDNAGMPSRIATTTELSFDVKWLSSGTLLVSFFQVRLSRHIRVSAMLSKNECSTALAAGSLLLLSPFGIKCQYLGTEDPPKSDDQRNSSALVKASILSRLPHQGTRNAQNVTWVQVQMGRESNFSFGPPVPLWPADLCLFNEAVTPVSGQGGELFKWSIVDGSTDPLEEAESWFLGKTARMEALQVKMQEEGQRAQVTKDFEDTDNEDALSPFETQMDQGITPQDVSGIYPTPPDGLPLALLGSSNSNNLQSGDYDDEEKELQPSDEARGDYDGQEDDDLFGDMDINMFASNGLTEADFRFFDEPGMIDENLLETGQEMALGDTHEITNHAMAFHERGMTAAPYERRDSGLDRNTTEDQENVLIKQGMTHCYQTADSCSAHLISSPLIEGDHALPTSDNDLPDKDHDKAPVSTVNTQNLDYGALERLNIDHGTTFQDAPGGQRGSFEHVPFQGSTFNFDDKYNAQGRFAFDVDELPIHLKHGGRPSYLDTHSSKFTVCPGKSSMENSVDTGQLLLSSPQV